MTEREMSLAGREAIAERDARLVAGLRERTPEAASQLCDRFGPKLLACAAARFPADRAVAERGHPPVTFANLPLPPRQQADDLFEAAKEMVQY